jgi:hypothetical protein
MKVTMERKPFHHDEIDHDEYLELKVEFSHEEMAIIATSDRMEGMMFLEPTIVASDWPANEYRGRIDFSHLLKGPVALLPGTPDLSGFMDLERFIRECAKRSKHLLDSEKFLYYAKKERTAQGLPPINPKKDEFEL